MGKSYYITPYLTKQLLGIAKEGNSNQKEIIKDGNFLFGFFPVHPQIFSDIFYC